jgi:tol-pal system protein YbgF
MVGLRNARERRGTPEIMVKHGTLAIGLLVALGAFGARAQTTDAPSMPAIELAQLAPPADVPDANSAVDEGQMLVRVDRLEAALRQANGQIEQLQNNQRRLEDALKKFQTDVEFRLDQGAPAGAAAPGASATPKSAKKADAFDPNANPNAPGAPKTLGSTQPSQPLAPAGPPMALNKPPPADAPPTVITANNGIDFSDAPRQQYNDSLDAYRAGQYEKAETGFKAFLAGNPSHRLTADATFFLGESFLQRSRPRDAAEQYLKVSTDFSKSARAPMAMMRLGQSLAMLGNSEQACGTFAEFSKRYPAADATLRKSVEREQERDHC